MGSLDQGMFAPSRGFLIELVLNCFFRASSAFKIFEAGLWSLELLLSAQQRLQDIRGWTSVPRITSFGPAAPSRYSRLDFGPLNCFFWASSAIKIFGAGLRSLELFFGSAAPSNCSRSGFDPSNCLFRPSNAFKEFELELQTFESSFSSLSLELSMLLFQTCPNLGGNVPVRMSYVKYEGKSTVCNTGWPGIRIRRALPENFPYLRYEVCTDGRIGCLTNELGSDLVSPTRLGSE
jgi:hypothetical protein